MMKITQPLRSANAVMKPLTIRDFSGGLNVVDNDLNLSSKFARKLRNLYRGVDGSIVKRFGTKLFAQVGDVLDSDICNMQYYNSALIAVGFNGNVAAIDGTASVVAIWNSAIANSLPGHPIGWGDITFCSFSPFKSDLIITNGVDKPLIVNNVFTTRYLVDLASGSNINVPIARYVITIDKYLVFANGSTLYISNQDTSGTFVGDAPPNDALQINVGGYVTQGDPTITGLGVVRGNLIIFFAEMCLPVTLGQYTGSPAVHTPKFSEAIVGHGSQSHRSALSLGDDLLFSDTIGVPSLSRALLDNSVVPTRVSSLIDPLIEARLKKLSLTSLQDRVFSVYNKSESHFMLFIPNSDDRATTTETICFEYILNKQLKIKSWNESRDWNFTAACKSSLNRVFFAKGSDIFVLGDRQDTYYADWIGDQEVWSDDTPWSDQTGFTPVADADDSGIPVRFDWELPWADMGARMLTKHSSYIALDTSGTARFTVDMFIDNIVLDRSDAGQEWTDGTLFSDSTGWLRGDQDQQYDPTLSLDFIGGDYGGFGLSPFGNNMGGGRNTSLETLYSWQSKFKIAKLRLWGESSDPLSIVSLSLLYSEGSIRR